MDGFRLEMAWLNVVDQGWKTRLSLAGPAALHSLVGPCSAPAGAPLGHRHAPLHRCINRNSGVHGSQQFAALGLGVSPTVQT